MTAANNTTEYSYDLRDRFHKRGMIRNMATNNSVTITFGSNFRRYDLDNPLDGVSHGATFADVIDDFTGGNGLRDDQTFRVAGEERELDDVVRPGDIIVVATESSASGGYKGARF